MVRLHGAGPLSANERAMSLEAEGFRFVLQDGEFGWVHPNLLKPEAVDLTDMPEPEFNAFVETVLTRSKVNPS